jgi:aconitate hydratase
VLPLTFADPGDYDRVLETDRITLTNLRDLAPGVPVIAILHHAQGGVERFELRHSLNLEQIAWFRAGSALNLLRRQSGGRPT